MIDQKLIDKINELARKQKTIGLTEEEKLEQQKLRKEYIDSVLGNIKGQLGNPNDYKKGGKK